MPIEPKEAEMKKLLAICVTAAALMGFIALPVLAFEAPVIKLERVEVSSIQPFYMTPKIKVPDPKDPKKTIEKVGKYGYSATLGTAYIFSIKNVAKEPIMLDNIRFTINFDGFEVNTLMADDNSWIPPGKTNYLRLKALNEAFPTMVNLMVGSQNAKRVTEMKTKASALVAKWWKEIADFSFPVEISGVALFKDDKGKELRVPIKGKFPK